MCNNEKRAAPDGAGKLMQHAIYKQAAPTALQSLPRTWGGKCVEKVNRCDRINSG